MKTIRRAAWCAASLVAFGATPLAHAGLGEGAPSVARDRATLRADAVTTTAMPSYTRHEMTTPDGASVREFTAADGTVFAVGFDGPAMPDMQTMLGSHYDDYLAAARAHRGNHHVMSFTQDGLAVTIVKLQRGFSGTAHIPALVPDGVRMEDLR